MHLEMALPRRRSGAPRVVVSGPDLSGRPPGAIHARAADGKEGHLLLTDVSFAKKGKRLRHCAVTRIIQPLGDVKSAPRALRQRGAPHPMRNNKEAVVMALKNFQAAPAAFTLPHVTRVAVVAWAAPVAPTLPSPVRASLVASDPQTRQAISRQFASDPRTELVAWARTLGEGLRIAEPSEVLLVERRLEDGDGIDLVRHLKEVRPSAEAIVLARTDDEQAALQAFDVGAAGWLVLGDHPPNFVLAVLNVANGGAALSPSLARRLMRRPVQGPRSMAQSRLAAITDREREVLAQIAYGLRSKEIARALAISDETVNAHVKSIYRKLQVHSRAQLVRVASQAGIC